MNLSKQAKSVEIENINDLIVDSILDIKGKNIVKLDLRNLEEAPAKYFIICEGDSTTQVRAICDSIHRKLRDQIDTLPSHKEGMDNSFWILMDYFDTVVHVFYRETRQFYAIEELWGDATTTKYESL